MSKRNLWLNISAYSLAHGLVDAACVAALFTIGAAPVTPGRAELQNLSLIILIYDVIAFSTQPVFGLLVDRSKAPARLAALGLVLVAASTLLLRAPLIAAVTAGIGNAIFHVVGGSISLDLAPGKATLPGIFVAPGALGLTLGILIGKSGSFTAWPFLLLLLGSAAPILAIPRAESRPLAGPMALARREQPENDLPDSALPNNLRWFETVIVLLLLSVAIRSLVGQSLILPWKADPALLIALTMAVVLGKALGGVLADRYGWAAVALSGLVISAPLLAFFAPLPALAIAGTFLFNLSMPVTLVCLSGMLPGASGFAFGLTPLALIIGALPAFAPLPAFMPLSALTGAPGFIFAAILVSIAALYGALRLYSTHFRESIPALQPGTLFEDK